MVKTLLAVIACGALFGGVAYPETQTVRVIGVKDGDTIECLPSGGRPETIRLSDIDAPEKK
jgi:endonuclease YncB( thermonuclease family)